MQIGQFVFSLRGCKVPRFLLDVYASLADARKTQDDDLIYHCAYTFPAVLLTVGVFEWPLLRDVYKNLIKKDSVNIMTTMAASIHEIAKIVGSEIAEAELDPIAKYYLKNKLTLAVMLSHLHDFLAVLTMKKRLDYLPIIQAIMEKSEHNWRQREIFARHSGDYARLFDIQKIHEIVLPISYTLLEDQVAQVRAKACQEFVHVAMQLKSEPLFFNEAITFLQKLFNSINFRDRQSFIQACEGFMCYEAIFVKHFLTQFLALQKDKVVNVRVALARVLNSHMKVSGVLRSNVHILRTIELLKNDSSREVRENVTEASKECDKMLEAIISNQEELEKAQEAAAASIDLRSSNDEELKEELRRQEVEKIVRENYKIDEIEDTSNN
eukprot:TRINITY_DN1530_c0_g2_i8.p1 TRINITY_DN1530_c0_g2~~TRINITY_DN1530_c0_g2_i8.p1  ORF type:complete len:382 (-),score=87.27 TRINITY_DN1530_c0_g2_i8:1176-2321(-)